MSAIKILDFHEVRRGSLLGFARVQLPSGLIVSDVVILTGEHGRWASPPGKPLIGRDGLVMKDPSGKVRYHPIIEFASAEIRSKWSSAIIQALQTTHPQAFDSAPADSAAEAPPPLNPQARPRRQQIRLPPMSRRKTERLDDDPLPF